MCVEFKFPEPPQGHEELRLARQEILECIKQLPLDYYTITSKRLPAGFLRKNNVADYRKALLAILNSDTIQGWLRVLETGWMSDSLKKYRLSEWICYVRYKTAKDKDYMKEALVAIADAEKWLDSARAVLESEFVHKMLEDDDRAAKEILVRRYGEHWSEKIQSLRVQARIAKELAESAKTTPDTAQTINFVLAGA